MSVQDPYDRREEHVIVDTGSAEVAQQVVEDNATERYVGILRITQFIWLMFGIVIGLIGLRILLMLIGANPASGFAALVYGVTDIFLWPFFGLTAVPSFAGFALDIPAVIGMLVYLLVGWLVVRLIWLMLYRPSTRSVSTVRRERRW
ncbi:MAG TPA: hypothetical protein VIO36_03660 [Anaerolineaceae bacterium]